MQELGIAGEQALQDVARRHGFSLEATRTMLEAVARGHGSMAQFSHREFGGSGQWMRGGMTMVSDMFNQSLKRSVDALCGDLAALIADLPQPDRRGSVQSPSPLDSPSDSDSHPHGAPFVSAADWWPGDLGPANASGAQNGARYAYFSGPRRLAIEVDGTVTVYDTQDHRIGGVSQQQSAGRSLTFTSQHGPIDVDSLPVVATVGGTVSPALAAAAAQPSHDLFAAIEKLAALHAKGVLTESEFVHKKADLLNRL